MRLGLSTYTYPWAIGVPGAAAPPRPLSRIELLDRAVALGVGVVQLADNLPVHDLDDDSLGHFHAAARDRGLDLEVGVRGLGPHLIRGAEVAHRLGADFVRVVVDAPGDHPTPREVLARLAEVRDAFTRRGLVLAIENHDRFRAHELADLVRTAGDWTGICLDTVNSLGALEGPDHVVEVLAPLCVNVHLKDVVARRHPSHLGFEIVGTPAGEGMLRIDALLAAVTASGRARTAVLELWTPPAADLAATIEREKDWAERSVRWLRTHTSLA